MLPLPHRAPLCEYPQVSVKAVWLGFQFRKL